MIGAIALAAPDVLARRRHRALRLLAAACAEHVPARAALRNR